MVGRRAHFRRSGRCARRHRHHARGSLRPVPFQEDEWVGGVLSFGEGDNGPAVAVTMRDIRCSMVNLDPESASSVPEVMKAVVRVNQNNAGIYGTVTRIGQLRVGQTILFRAATGKREGG